MLSFVNTCISTFFPTIWPMQVLGIKVLWDVDTFASHYNNSNTNILDQCILMHKKQLIIPSKYKSPTGGEQSSHISRDKYIYLYYSHRKFIFGSDTWTLLLKYLHFFIAVWKILLKCVNQIIRLDKDEISDLVWLQVSININSL